jgi:anthranilate phosphoribosyltransferase
MVSPADRELGQLIGRVIARENLNREESFRAFSLVLGDQVTPLQQGAFLAAMSCKKETAAELAGGWRAVYELDTCRVEMDDLPLLDNCGTGMDSFKTFNISTAAALVAAAGGLYLARHGSRAISSTVGTVDVVEQFGVDVECPAELVASSVRKAGIGLFNGMSPRVHPKALGRVLSQLSFGSPLNIVASLAHPAMPRVALRGVSDPALLRPVAETMAEIGYRRALVVYGAIEGSGQGMDEASVCGRSSFADLRDGDIREFTLEPEDCGLPRYPAAALAADRDPRQAARRIYRLLAGQGGEGRQAAVSLNAGLLFYIAGETKTIVAGVAKAAGLLAAGTALATLQRWVACQNRDPKRGLATLAALAAEEACDA